jgi:ferredoxin
MGINVSKKNAVYDTRCNRCGECLTACPIEGCLDHALPLKKKMSLKSRIVTAAVIVIIFIAPIYITQRTGLFTDGSRPNEAIVQLTAEEIESSMTMEELANGFNIDLPTLLEYLSLPSNISGSVKLRDLEDIDENVNTKIVRKKMEEFL